MGGGGSGLTPPSSWPGRSNQKQYPVSHCAATVGCTLATLQHQQLFFLARTKLSWRSLLTLQYSR